MADSSAPPTVELETYFNALSEWWHEATDVLSSPSEKAQHPAYRRVVKLGPAVLPYLFRELAMRGGSGWYTALRELTGASPVPADAASSSDRVKEIWLGWGREHGYL